MDLVLRAAGIYLVLVVLFRIAGRRTLANLSSFDLVLLLIISEGCQQALMTSQEFSFMGPVIVVVTFIMLDVFFSLVKRKNPRFARWVDGLPLVLMEDGRLNRERLERARLSEEDILSTAREHRGLTSLDQIEAAVLEASGSISIIPKPSER